MNNTRSCSRNGRSRQNSNAIGANYTQLLNLPVNRWELRLRGDYNISQKTKAFFSWNRQDETDINPISVWWGTSTSVPYPSVMPANQVSQVYSSNVTNVFTPSLTNEFAAIIKNSSVALTIGLVELTAATYSMREFTFQTFESMTGATVIYVIISGIALLLARWLEKAIAIPGFIAAGSANTGGH